MEKHEGEAFVGKVLAVGLGSRYIVTRFDYRRRTFTTRNLHTEKTGELDARTLEDAISDGIITVTERRNKTNA